MMGQLESEQNSLFYVFPPLWGKDSFNWKQQMINYAM